MNFYSICFTNICTCMRLTFTSICILEYLRMRTERYANAFQQQQQNQQQEQSFQSSSGHGNTEGWFPNYVYNEYL
jgi:hypothetical protein